MSTCCVEQIQHATTRVSKECPWKILIICAPEIIALAEKFEAVKLMMGV